MDKIEGLVSSLNHNVSMTDRKNIVITGVKKIGSFDNKEFFLETTMGYMSIKGSDLEIIKLDTYQGNVSIKGLINGITYQENLKKEKEESLLTKLFK